MRSPTFSKLLVANRGEIALRVMRSAHALGLRTVAAFSEADADSPHVAAADEAICIGAAAARDSYLNIDRLLEAATRTGADALHPGYGFLSESAELARRCEEAGLRFVGPPAEAIRVMGDKARAKARMVEAGVPVVPGYHGAAQDEATLSREAQRMGFPVLIKASSGGGGRGMRVARSAAELPELLRNARTEATAAFGSGDLLLERLVEKARHVEIQIFADTLGHVLHLGERDCSTQRRHQKVLEESPSPAVGPELRQRMGEAAVAAARAVGYVGAGTVEFLLDPDGSFYFMEMNTRLQVEHAVTEFVTGLDLVAWQLMVASGAELPLRQEQVGLRGHAIEARLYAEDPYQGFLPQAGRVLAFQPAVGEGVRIDAGVARGQEIRSFYDPLLAKVIAHGETRELARRRLVRALEETLFLGPMTNRELLLSVLEGEPFLSGAMTTGHLDEWFTGSTPPQRRAPHPATAALAAVLLSEREGGMDAWRSAGRASWTVRLSPRHGSEEPVTVAGGAGGRYQAVVDGRSFQIALLCRGEGEVRCELDGVQRTARYAFEGERLHLDLAGAATTWEEPRPAQRVQAAASDGRIKAPISGQVIAVDVVAGARIEARQCLLVLSAMKMEHRVLAPVAGVVERVAVRVGDQVSARQLLASITLEPSGGTIRDVK